MGIEAITTETITNGALLTVALVVAAVAEDTGAEEDILATTENLGKSYEITAQLLELLFNN